MSNQLMAQNQNEISFSQSPVLVAAWPGMGNIGLIAADYLKRKMDAQLYGTLDLRPFFVPPAGLVKDGKFVNPEPQVSSLHYRYSPDMLIYESNLQISGREGLFLLQNLFEIAQKHKVKQIFTISAIPQPVSYTREPELYFASNSVELSEKLTSMGVKPLVSGEIPGAAGLLPSMASGAGIEAACIMATMPAYAAGVSSYPKGALSVLTLLRDFMEFSIDLEEVREAVETLDEQFARIEEQVREQFPAMLAYEEQEGEELMEERFALEAQVEDEDGLAPEDRERLEQLFMVVAADRSKGVELKKELDRLRLYRKYENRFLDLFI